MKFLKRLIKRKEKKSDEGKFLFDPDSESGKDLINRYEGKGITDEIKKLIEDHMNKNF
jgi:hypothetical protein